MRDVARARSPRHHEGMGVEVLAFLTVFGFTTTAILSGWWWLLARKKSHFLAALQHAHVIESVEHGDVAHPLSFTVVIGAVRTRVAAVVRGEQPLWHIERDVGLPLPGRVVVVERSWRSGAREGRGLPELDDVGLPHELLVLSAHLDAGRVLARVQQALGALLTSSSHAHQCVLESGRAFLELPREGFSLDELLRGLACLDDVVDVVSGRPTCPRPPGPPRALLESHNALAHSSVPVAVPSGVRHDDVNPQRKPSRRPT